VSEHDEVDWSQLDDLDEGVAPLTISEDMLAKRVLWDVVPCRMAVDVVKRMGLQPASPDVEDMEHTESHERLRQVAPVAPFVHAMSRHAAHAVIAAMLVSNDVDLPDDIRVTESDKLHPVLTQATLAVIAELVDVGMLHLPHGYVLIGEAPTT
jgi:hypothetical protein